jgi:5'-3' exonuclease
MGIKGFSKKFKHQSVTTLKEFAGKIVAIDALAFLYRACLGMEHLNALTNNSGESTVHIKVIVDMVIKFRRHNITQIWVWDYDHHREDNAAFHNSNKLGELKIRKEQKNRAHKKFKELSGYYRPKTTREKELFSSDDEMFVPNNLVKRKGKLINQLADEAAVLTTSESKTGVASSTGVASGTGSGGSPFPSLEDQKNKLEKQAFRISDKIINSAKLILNILKITWVEAPEGYEGECLAARLTHDDVKLADAVFSSDTDVILFKATNFIRVVGGNKSKSKLRANQYPLYQHKSILKEEKITHEEFVKMAIIMGCDFFKEEADKKKRLFFRIGPKTALKKIRNGSLDEQFKNPRVVTAMKHCNMVCPYDTSQFVNYTDDSFSTAAINKMIKWLYQEQNFDKPKLVKRFAKMNADRLKLISQ